MSIHATSTESYTGKNLFDKNNPNLFSGYFDGNSSSPTIVSGVANRNRIIFIPCKPNTTYSLSAQNLQGITQIQVGTTSAMPAAGVSVYSLGYFGDNKTTPNDAKYLLARVQSNVEVDIADILQDFLSGLQIEIGSTATSYEPYISHFGKNMFDWNYIANSGATFGTNNSNGTVEVDTYGIHYKNPTGADQYFTVNGYGAVEPNAASVMRMYNLSPNTRYTISYTATNYSQVFIRFFNLSGGIVQTLSSSVTAAGRVSFSFTTPASTYGYQIRIDNEAYGHDLPSLDNDISNIQIETGSTATSYEPYVESLPSPLIRDVLHVSTSKNLLNLESDSNGEYLGTISQHGYVSKNLYTGSPSFAGYANINSWENGGTYNGMPVIKKAGSWSGAFKLVDIVAGKTYTFSVWVKSDQAKSSVAIYATGGSTGATATISPGSKAITTATDWERVSFTFTCSTSGSIALRVENWDSSTTNYTYISGYQLELGPEATSYEPYLGDGVYSGTQMLTKKGIATPSTDTSFWASFSDLTQVDSGNGWATLTRSITSGYSNLQTSTSSVGLVGGNTYTAIVEIQNCSINSGYIIFAQTSSSADAVSTFTVVNGCDYVPSAYFMGATLNGNSTSKYNVYTFTTKSSFTRGLRYFIDTGTGTGSLDIRATVLSGDHSSDWQNYCGDNYEPYVGGVPSPNPDYPQEIVTGKLASKNLFALNKTSGTIADVLYTYNSDGTFSLSGTASAGTGAKSAPILLSESGLVPGKKYSFWCDHNIGWGSNSCVYYVQSCDSSGTWIANLMTFSSNGTATMPSTTAQYVMFVAAISNGSSYSSYNNVKAQLVASEQIDNAFEPYFTPIELAQIGSYQDKVHKSGSSWYTHKELDKIVLDGTENWNDDWQNSGTPGYWQVYIKAVDFTSDYQVSGANNTLCDHFIPSGTNSVWNFQGYGFALNPSTTYTLQFKMPSTFMNSVANFKTWLGSNNTTAYYTLGTATDTAITDSATIAWLNKYDTDLLPHHKYINTRRTTYVGASGLASAIDLYNGSYASALPTYSTANDHHLTTANEGTYTVSLQNISASIISGTVTFSVFTNQRKIDFSWNGSATSTSVSVSLQADEYIKSIYAYIPQDADAGITLSQQLESGSLTDFEPYYNIVKIYSGDDLVFEDTSL